MPALHDLHAEDDGVAEALRREAEAKHDESVILSLEEFQRGIAAMTTLRRATSSAPATSHPLVRTPYETYGPEFFCQPFILKQADGSQLQCHDVCVCINPKENPATTLEYAWQILRELAEWICEEFKDNPTSETYRIVIAWSKSVREHQGHIVKVWCDLANVRKIAECATPEDWSARFGGGWTPFRNWQKDVFAQKD